MFNSVLLDPSMSNGLIELNASPDPDACVPYAHNKSIASSYINLQMGLLYVIRGKNGGFFLRLSPHIM